MPASPSTDRGLKPVTVGVRPERITSPTKASLGSDQPTSISLMCPFGRKRACLRQFYVEASAALTRIAPCGQVDARQELGRLLPSLALG